MLCPKPKTFTENPQTTFKFKHSPKISNRRDNLLVKAEMVEHLRMEILVMIYECWRKCSTPTGFYFLSVRSFWSLRTDL